MNILFLTPRDSKTNLGGVEGHVRLLTEELVRRGHEVKELALDGLYKGPTLPWQGRTLGYKFRAWIFLWDRKELFRWAEVVHVHDVFWWYLPFGLLNRVRIFFGSFNLFNRVVERDTNDPNEHPNDTNRKPIFTTFHGWEGVCPPGWSAVWQKKLAKFLSDGTIGVGSFFKKWYEITTNKIVYGVLEDKWINRQIYKSTNKRISISTIVFLGRLEEVNGVEVVLEALNKLVSRQIYKYTNRQIHKLQWGFPRIVFVGEGSYRKQAEKLGRVTGMIKNPQKYLINADVVITSSYMSILEAAAMGKPVISVANSELKEDYLNCHPLREWIKVVKNTEELTNAIREVQEGTKKYKKRQKCLNKTRAWVIKQTTERLADVYEEVWG